MATWTPAPELVDTAVALRSFAVVRDLAAQWRAEGIDVMVLKGPPLQARLYGTPAAYRSGDIDLLVCQQHGSGARRLLEGDGWRFEAENGALWRASRAATYERDGIRVDLHWGLHAAHLPATALRALEQALWESAEPAPQGGGLLQPGAAALVVYLALHAAGHSFERPCWVENVRRAAGFADRSDVDAIATQTRLRNVVRRSLVVADGRRTRTNGPLLDGLVPALTWAIAWVARGHFVPGTIRTRVRQTAAHVTRRATHVPFATIDVVVDDGVFRPRAITEHVVARTLTAVDGIARPVIVDVGTGCGAVALAVATSRPDAVVHGIDTSTAALRNARANARRHRVTIQWHRGSLLTPLPAGVTAHVVAANIPYVPPGSPIGTMAAADAIGAEHDGLGLIRRLARDAREVLVPGGQLVIQIADSQWEAMAAELVGFGYETMAPDERRPGRAVVASARWTP